MNSCNNKIKEKLQAEEIEISHAIFVIEPIVKTVGFFLFHTKRRKIPCYDIAKWFAHRFGEDGTVYQAKINKEHILALFNGQNESEIIVEPQHLIDIEPAESLSFGLTMT